MTRYCKHCGGALVAVEVDGKGREQCGVCAAVIYRNPAPVVLARIEYDGRLVMVRRGLDPLRGYWAPPGGYVECGESLVDAVVREAREETALDIAVDGLIDVYSQADVEVVILAYRAHVIGGVPVAGDDADEIALFSRGELPRQRVDADASPLARWFGDVIHTVTADWQWPLAHRRSS